MGDIDILVQQPDLLETAASLCQMGYCWKTEAPACRQEALDAWMKEEPLAEHLTPFLKATPPPD